MAIGIKYLTKQESASTAKIGIMMIRMMPVKINHASSSIAVVTS